MRIQINLLGGPRKKKAGAGISLPNIGELIKGIKDPLLIGAVAAWIVVGTGAGYLFVTMQAEVAGLRDEATQARQEARRFSNMIAQKRRAERLRDSLETELREIRSIDADRYVWPHVLEEVTKSLPDYTWLVGLNVVQAAPAVTTEGEAVGPVPVRFMIDGRTSDIGAYTRFLRNLANSPWVANVVPGANRTVVEDDKALTAFSITATFRSADSAFIRTVPVSASVR
jgi:Tfp pilus assembly protein PilN